MTGHWAREDSGELKWTKSAILSHVVVEFFEKSKERSWAILASYEC